MDEISETGVYAGSNLWGDGVWTTNFAAMQVDHAGFIIGFNTASSASGINKIYYGVLSSNGKWVTKIADV